MVVPTTMLKLPQPWVISKTMSINEKNVHEMPELSFIYICYVTYITSRFYSNTFSSGHFWDKD